MKNKLAASCILLSTLLAPYAAYAADSDKDATTPKEFVKDSVITSKIKAKLAEQKMSSTIHIKVDTTNKGVVQLSGTAKTQAEIDKAGEIASLVAGVTSVENNIQIGKGRHAMHHEHETGDERVEHRITDMHAKLQITPAQEEQWGKVAMLMRENEKQMDMLTKTRAEKADMNAIDDLKSYREISEAHTDGLRKFTPAFETLYGSMSDEQKKNADAIFRQHGRRHAKHT
ncbi:MAG: BON domain-containing protein [Burkholderiaceae bacterium]